MPKTHMSFQSVRKTNEMWSRNGWEILKKPNLNYNPTGPPGLSYTNGTHARTETQARENPCQCAHYDMCLKETGCWLAS